MVDSVKVDACNIHAFCSVCSYDGGTKIHSNCKAMIDKVRVGQYRRLHSHDLFY